MSAWRPRGDLVDSKVAWLGSCPPEWEILPFQAVFRERREDATSDGVHLTPSQKFGVLPQKEYMLRTGAKVVLKLDLSSKMRRVHTGDFVSHLRSFQGGIELSTMDGKVSSAYTVIEPIRPIETGYFRYLFKSEGYIQGLQSTTDQLRDGQSIKQKQLALLKLPLPSVREQAQIAGFLDRETAQIDALIAKQEQLLRLLKERLNAAVYETISGDSAEAENSDMREFGLTRPAPSLRSLTSLRWLVHVQSGFPFPSPSFTTESEHVRLLRGVNVGVGEIRWKETMRLSPAHASLHQDFALAPGDVVLGLDRPIISSGVRVATIEEEDVPALLVQRVARISSRIEVDPRYLRFCLQSQWFSDYLAPVFTGVSVPHMSADQLKSFRIWAPSLAVQKKIVRELEELTARTGEISKKATEMITLLKERRQALISAAVTGKIDVTGKV